MHVICLGPDQAKAILFVASDRLLEILNIHTGDLSDIPFHLGIGESIVGGIWFVKIYLFWSKLLKKFEGTKVLQVDQIKPGFSS